MDSMSLAEAKVRLRVIVAMAETNAALKHTNCTIRR
jgi:hypothetical protein